MEPKPTFQIRDAIPADLPALRELAKRAYFTAAPEWNTDRSDFENWVVWLDRFFEQPMDGQYVLVAASEENDVWGMAHVMQFSDALENGSHPHLETVAVMPHAEGRGVASGLIEASAARAKQDGAHEITLNVYIANSRAQALYERLGFQRDWIKMRRPV